MRRAACAGLVLAALASAHTDAGAAEGLILTWNACAGAPGATSDQTNPCNLTTGTQSLFCTFQLAQSLDSLIAAEVTLDIQHANPTLPDWWRFGSEDCHAGGLVASTMVPPTSGCADPWDGRATGIPPVSFFPGLPGGNASRERILVTLVVPPDMPVRLEPGVLYQAVRIDVRNQGTLSCPGCSEGACLVLNSILLGRAPGAPGGDLLVQSAASTESNFATWQGGAGADCAAVPVRRTTWGRLKGLYR